MSFPFIHPTSIVDPGASIGSNTYIWHWTHISSGAHVGSNCTIGQNVYLASNSFVGNDVKIQNNVSIYDGVKLNDSVFCGPSVVFTNVINPRSHVPRRNEYRETTVKHGATLGANSTILCGIDIGEFAFIAAGSVVTRDVKPFALVLGVPAVQVGWMSSFGSRIDLPVQGNGSWLCPHTAETYQLIGSDLLRLP